MKIRQLSRCTKTTTKGYSFLSLSFTSFKFTIQWRPVIMNQPSKIRTADLTSWMWLCGAVKMWLIRNHMAVREILDISTLSFFINLKITHAYALVDFKLIKTNSSDISQITFTAMWLLIPIRLNQLCKRALHD